MVEHVVVLGHYRSRGDLLKLERVTFGGMADSEAGAEDMARDCCSAQMPEGIVILPRIYEVAGRKQLRAIMLAAQARYEQFEALCRDAAKATRRQRRGRE